RRASLEALQIRARESRATPQADRTPDQQRASRELAHCEEAAGEDPKSVRQQADAQPDPEGAREREHRRTVCQPPEHLACSHQSALDAACPTYRGGSTSIVA